MLRKLGWSAVWFVLVVAKLGCAGRNSASGGNASAGSAGSSAVAASAGSGAAAASDANDASNANAPSDDAATSSPDADTTVLFDAGMPPEIDAGDSNASTELLASHQDNPLAIAVDAENVYWLNAQYLQTYSRKLIRQLTPASVLKCSRTGCGDHPTVLASNRVVSDGAGFAVDDKYAYWSDNGASSAGPSLVRCALDGCNDTPEVLGSAGADRIAINGTSIFGSKFEATVFSCSKGPSCGSTVDAIWSAGYSPVATGIAVDENGVYWGTEATVQLMYCPFTGCNGAPTVLMPQPNPIAELVVIALGPDTVYMADSNPQGFGAVYSCPKSGCVNGPTLLAKGLDAPVGIAVDAANVYWVENAALQRCKVGGCNLEPTTLLTTNAYPRALALDAQNIYFTIASELPGEGEIWRMAKP